MKNCDRGLENAARGRRSRAAFSSPRSQFYTIQNDPKPVNNLSVFFSKLSNEKKNSWKKTLASVTVTVVRGNPDRAKSQSDCRIRYRARLEKNKLNYFLTDQIC